MLDFFKKNKKKETVVKEPKTYSPFAAYVFTTNHLIGTGIIALPYTVFAGGALLSVIFLLLVTVISIITMLYLVETESRTQALMNVLGANEGHFVQGETVELDRLLKTNSYDIKKVRNQLLKIQDNQDEPLLTQISNDSEDSNEDSEVHETKPLLNEKDDVPKKNVSKNDVQDMIKNPQFDITRKYEIIDMCKMFLGKKGKVLYFIMLTLFLFGTAWSYGAVFGSSIVTLFPITSITKGDHCDIDGNFSHNCQNNYLLYIFLFSLVVVPISCLDLTEQRVIQIFLCAFRYLALFSIIFTIIVSMAKKDNPYVDHKASIAPGSGLLKWGGVDLIFTTGIFTQCSHHSITIIAEPVDNKRKIRKVITAALTSTFFFYAFVGVLCSLFFGHHTNTVITLNWMNYTGEQKNARAWASIIKYIVIMFPIFDLISIFPLKVVTLGTGMQTFFYPETIGKTDRRSKRIKIAFRLIWSITPLCGAMIIKELPVIIFFVGICGCFIAFIIPAWVQLKSKSISNIVFNKNKTPYSDYSNKPVIIWITMIFGIFSLFCSMVCSIINLVRKYKK
ncbi:acid transporter [Anaeramoeba flamelloides]|uniref:Acid transporter n=1 Tax=Anaeramoeba flamelloides TaxID=1746091 RepID=A0ABQ8Y5J8_9EUKA|nr:acid transporter [Anaeramoeba flamelloides]